MAVKQRGTKKGASKRPAGRRAALHEPAATPPLSSLAPRATPPLPPSVLFAQRLRAGDETALPEIKETSLKALYTHGLLEHYHLLDDVLNDRIQEEVAVPGIGLVTRNPSIDQKLKAYQLMQNAVIRRTQGGASALPGLGEGVRWGLVLIPTADPVPDAEFVEVPHANGNGHRAA